MTKIKDLVTVLADNAFSLFPIDVERYELEVAVGLYASHPWDVMKHYQHGNERINSFLKSTDETICRCAGGYSRTFFDAPVSKVDEDRAARVTASLDSYEYHWLEYTEEEDVLANTRTQLWQCLRGALSIYEGRARRLGST